MVKKKEKYNQELKDDENISIKQNIFISIKDTKIVYPTLISKIEKLCGSRIIDIILHTPCNYELYKRIETIKQLDNCSNCCVEVEITEIPNSKVPFYIQQKKHIPVKIKCKSIVDDIEITLIFFNLYPKMLDSFYVGKKMVCQGKIKIDNNYKYSIVHPHFPLKVQAVKGISAVYKLNQLEANGYDLTKMKFDGIAPIYRLADGIKQYQVINYVEKILNDRKYDFACLDGCDYIINNILIANNKDEILPSFRDAIIRLHFPSCIDDIISGSKYRKKLSFLELLSFQFALSKTRANKIIEKGNIIKGNGALCEKLINNLPFELTYDQTKCLQEIYQDQASEKKMLRLLQGDVGCGKTIVALLACLNCIEAGKKAIIMAPTSILAKQHFATINNLCFGLGIHADLLIGETKQKVRKDILCRLKLGMIDILVGTHTLFQKKIELPNNIGLFIIDEQHNFGVEQRVNLINKSGNADTLMMTATPIPRTMIMTLYGDIQVSRISHKPSNRLPIETKVLSFEEKYEALVKGILRKIDAGEKIYWVCPFVEESEKLDYIDVKTRFDELSKIINKDKIGLIHGKMKQEEKDRIMLSFKNGDTKLLIATSVIEVGIDVPDATIIVIENAERFGLAQLHQLRGRVGRGDKQSYCFLLYGNNVSDIGKERLEILKKYDDGFLIADADLKIRGGGAILSSQQSGFNTMKFVNFMEDKEIINILNKVDLNNINKEKISNIIKIFNYDFEKGSNMADC